MENDAHMYNIPVLARDLQQQYQNDLAATTMAKCTKSCFMSMKESTLLPTEERCLRNCFIKSHAFVQYTEFEMNYAMRNLK